MTKHCYALNMNSFWKSKEKILQNLNHSQKVKMKIIDILVIVELKFKNIFK